MITFFSTAKPFVGHIDVIQRNALQSWTRLSGCEVILMGDDGGSAEVAREFGLIHISEIARNEYGSGLVDDMFARAEAGARHDILCYVNADIILMSDFLRAAERVCALRAPFLMCGRRRLMAVTEPLTFDELWEERLRQQAATKGFLDDYACVDYFLFSRGVFGEIPPFAIGRKRWDRWLQYRARASGAHYIDATAMVMAIHQQHDYGGKAGFTKHKAGPESKRNIALAGTEYCDLRAATHKLTPSGVKRAVDRVRLQWRLRQMTKAVLQGMKRFEARTTNRSDSPNVRRLGETSHAVRRLIRKGRGGNVDRIAVVGLGKIGLPLAVSFAAKGHRVVGVDTNRLNVAAIEAGAPDSTEPGLSRLLAQSRKRLKVRGTLERAASQCKSTWLILPTQRPGSGFTADVLLDACETVGRAIRERRAHHVIVIVSTTLPGWTGGIVRTALEQASGKIAGRDFGLCYCPALVALGHAVEGFLAPYLAIIGESDARSGDTVVRILGTLWDRPPTVIRTNFVNAELTKLALNTFVSTKISFANVLAQMCEQLPGANVDVVTSALQCDPRVGRGYITGGSSYGGPCFPADVPAFAAVATQLGAPPDLALAVDAVNNCMTEHVVGMVRETTLPGHTVGVCGVTFKTGSRSLEGSPGLSIARALAALGYDIRLFDPDVDPRALSKDTGFEVAASLLDCVQQSDTIVLARSCRQFASLKKKLQKATTRPRSVIDCWRQLDATRIETIAEYHAVGLGPRQARTTDIGLPS